MGGVLGKNSLRTPDRGGSLFKGHPRLGKHGIRRNSFSPIDLFDASFLCAP
jgi:hypothetical protein